MKLALAGLVALGLAMGVGRFAFTPLLPMMQSEGLVSLAAGGWLAAANYAGYLAGAVWATFQRASSPFAIRAGLLGIGLTTLAMAAAPGLTAAMALRALAGVASAWVLVHVSASCLGRVGARGGGIVFSGVGLGIIAAGLACLALMSAGGASSLGWALLGAASLVLCVPLWSAFPPGSEQRVGAQAPAWRPYWTVLVACYGAFGFGYIIPATYLPVMAREAIGDPRVFGWAWPLFGAAAAASTVAAAALLARASARSLWAAAQLVMAAGVAAPLVLAGFAGPLAAALCVGGTFVAVTMLGMQEARRVAFARAPQLMAAMTAAFALGQIAGPLVVTAWLHAGGSLEGALAVAAAALVASTLSLALPARR